MLKSAATQRMQMALQVGTGPSHFILPEGREAVNSLDYPRLQEYILFSR